MDLDSVCAILNELLAAEQRAIAPRLFESTVFVSALSISEFPVVQRIVQQAQRNCERLTTKILECGGVPAPRLPVAAMANMHFQDLHHVVPLVIADQEALVRTYKAAAQQLAPEPGAAELVTRILELHFDELEELRRLLEETSNGAPTGLSDDESSVTAKARQ